MLQGRTAADARARRVLNDAAKHGFTGFAWAARRGVLAAMGGLYDAAATGGGDTLIAQAMWGHYPGGALPRGGEPYYYASRLFGAAGSEFGLPAAERHFRAWAERCFGAVGGSVGFVPGTALHLWHGDRADRQYGTRFAALGRAGFDPSADLAVDPGSGAWAWATEKTELHVALRQFFARRREVV